MQFDSVKSMIQSYRQRHGGFARHSVNAPNRAPFPPAMTSASVRWVNRLTYR
jgi:hypothetical protein